MAFEDLRNVLAAVLEKRALAGRGGGGGGRGGGRVPGEGRVLGGRVRGAGAELPKALNQSWGETRSRSFGSTLQAFLSPRSPEGKVL